MKWIRFFGNFEGRIPRKTFWLANVVVFVIEVILAAIAAAASRDSPATPPAIWRCRSSSFRFLYPSFVIALKRAHDLEMSSQVIYAWYIVLAVYSVLVRFAGWLWINLTQNIYSLVVLAFVFVFIFVVGIVSLALLIELGFRRGTRGSNRFGPDPLAKT